MNIINYIIKFLSLFYFFTISSSYKVCKVLTLGGGGSFGAVEIGILRDLIEKEKITGQFDVITGISAGGLNAAFLSYGDNISENLEELEEFYKKVKTKDVYNKNIFRSLKDWSIFNNRPLECMVKKIVNNKIPLKNSPVTLIGATNLNTQKLDIFRYDKLNRGQQSDVLLATTAIPILFKPKKINNCLYIDGGTIENEIIYQVLDEYQADYYHFTVVCSTNKMNKCVKINNVVDFIKSITMLLVNNYIYDIAKIKNSYFDCKKGRIDICYPTDPELSNYNYLNFNNGEQLLKIGKNNYTIESINFC